MSSPRRLFFSRVLVVVSTALLLAGVLFVVFHSEDTTLTIPAPDFVQNQQTVNVKLKSYSAERVSDTLYIDSGVAEIKDGKLTYTWQIPDQYKKRDTYVELCIESTSPESNDTVETWCSKGVSSGETNNNSDSGDQGALLTTNVGGGDSVLYKSVSCAYYIPNNSRGIIADLLGWNKLDENQQVGCVDTTNQDNQEDTPATRYASYIQALGDFQTNSLADSNLSIEGDQIIVSNPDGNLAVENISTLVQEVLNGETLQVAGSTGARGQMGPAGPAGATGSQGEKGATGDKGADGSAGTQGATGATGAQGIQGEKGDPGNFICEPGATCNAPQGPAGATGSAGLQGPQGIQGEKGETGATGAKGDKGDPGDDGVTSVSGGGLVLNNHVLSLRSCTNGQILKVVNGVWECAADGGGGADNDTLYQAGDGLNLTTTAGNNVFSIDATVCTTGQYLTWNGSSFSCAADQNTLDTNTTYTAGNGINISGANNDIAISAPTCATGQYLTWNGTTFACATDQITPLIADNDTKYHALANGGLTLDGSNNFALITCSDTQILKWNGANSRWECSADQDTTYDLTGYLQIANLQTELNNLTPGYYTKTQVDTLLTNFASTIPAGGLDIPQEVAKESDLSVANCTAAGNHFYIQNMDVTAPNHTGRAWCYEDTSGVMRLYKIYDNYLGGDNSSIITNNGVLSVSTTWLDNFLSTKDYATESLVDSKIAAIDFTPYVKKTDIPTCSTGYVLTSSSAGVLTCVSAATVDNDTLYQAGNGLNLTTTAGNNVFSIDATACAPGQYLTWNGSSFSCAADQNTPDTNTTYTAGNGINLSGASNAIAISAPTCATGQYLTWNGTAFSCNTDAGTVLPNGATNDQILTWNTAANSGAGGWILGTLPTDTNTTYAAKTGGGLQLDTTTNEFALQNCTNQQILIYDTATTAWQCANLQNSNLPNGTADGQMLYWDDTAQAWQLSGTAGANQNLDDLTATNVKVQNGLDMTAASGGLKDFYGNMGQKGQKLTIDDFGRVAWQDDMTCVSNVAAPVNMLTMSNTDSTVGTSFNSSDSTTTRVGDEVYFLRMAGTWQNTTNWQKINIKTGVITTLKTFPTGATYLPNVVSAEDGDHIYVFGGSTASNGATGSVLAYKYEISTDTWTQIANIPQGLFYAANVVDNGKIYSISGTLSSFSYAGQAVVQILDMSNDTWSSAAIANDMASALKTSFKLDGRIYVLVDNGSLIKEYFPSTNTMTSTGISVPGYGMGASTGVYQGKEFAVVVGVNSSDSVMTNQAVLLWHENGVLKSRDFTTPFTAHYTMFEISGNEYVKAGGGYSMTNTMSRGSIFADVMFAYDALDVDDRYLFNVGTRTSAAVESMSGVAYAAGTTIPANTEIKILTDGTELFLEADITADGSWIRRAEFCDGGAGGNVDLSSLEHDIATIAGSLAMGGANLPNGTTAGEMLYWDGTSWVLSGAGGNQTLDFVTADKVTTDNLTVNADALVTGNLTTGGLVDAYGRTGSYGEHLVIDINGNLKWELETSCATVIQPTAKPYTYFPMMANNSSPSPFVTTGSSQLSASYQYYMAFDNNPSTLWHNDNTHDSSPTELQIGSPTYAFEVSSYSITSRATFPTQAPRDWTLQGSNDGTNWTIVDTQSSITFSGQQETKTFTLSAPVQYNYYKLVITAQGGYIQDATSIAELKFFGAPSSPTTKPLLTVKAGDRYSVPAQTVADQVVEDTSGNSYAIGDTIPAGTEVLILTDGTNIGLLDNITTDTGWVRRAEFCGITALPGGATYSAGDGIDIDSQNNISLEYIDANGNFIFQNAQGDTNKTFQIASASGDVVFNVDTLNHQVAIGGGSNVDQTPFALVLDSYGDGTSTDPAQLATEGAMYYNTDLKRFRCYEDGTWKNCIGSGGSSASGTVNSVNQIQPDATGDVTLGAHDVGTYTDDEIDQAIDEELTFEYLKPTQYLQANAGPTNGTWAYINGTVVDSNLYTFGYYVNGYSASSYKYDFNTGAITQIAPISSPRVAMGITNDGQTIYMVGGEGGGLLTMTTAQKYDPATNTYSAMAALPVPLSYPAAEYYNGKIYVFGGVSNGNLLDSIYRYDIATDSWTLLPETLAQGARGIKTTVIDGKVYLVGGANGAYSDAYDTFQIFDLATETITSGSSLIFAQGHGGIIPGNDYFISFGGLTSGGTSTTRAQRYDIATDTWQEITISGFTGPRNNFAYGTYNNKSVVLGGISSSAAYYSDGFLINNNADTILAYLKVGEKIYADGAMRSDVPMDCGSGATTTLPANTECTALADTRVYPISNINTGWIRRGGAGGPIQIGVIVPTTWTDDIVKKNGETWLKLNGQLIDSSDYPALANAITTYTAPAMTSNTAPAPYVVSASSTAASYYSWYAFDKVAPNNLNDNMWVSAATTGWLQLKLDSAHHINSYSITSRGTAGSAYCSAASNYCNDQSPRDWTLQGSNDGANWTTLDTQTGQAWTPIQTKTFPVSTSASYQYYRLDVTANLGGAYLAVGELSFGFSDAALPNYGTNAQGQYYYIKADGYTNNGYTIQDGTASGQVLTWDSTLNQWVAGSASGGGGATYFAGEGIDIDSGNVISLEYIDASGNFVFKNAQGDTTASFQIADAAGNTVFNVDTVSGLVTISGGLNVAGNVNLGGHLDGTSATFSATVSAQSVIADNAIIKDAQIGKVRDAFGNYGTAGQILTVDAFGNLIWQDNIAPTPNISVNGIGPDSDGNIQLGAHDVGTYTDDEIDQAIDEELTFEYLDAPIDLVTATNLSVTAPISYRRPGSVALGNYLYSFGGIATNYTANAYKYDVNTGAATAIATYPPGPTAGMAVATDGTYIYIFGGDTSATYSRGNVYRYDPAADTYTLIGNITADAGSTYGASEAEAVYHNGKIYIVGGVAQGTDNSTAYDRLLVYDIATATYTNYAGFLPSGRSRVNLQLVGDTLYIMGGIDTTDTALDEVYSVNLSSPTLSLTTLASMTSPRYLAAVYYEDGQIFLVGGNNSSGNATGAVQVYSIATNSWRLIVGVTNSSVSATAWGQFDDSLLVAGGYTTLGVNLNTVRKVTFNARPVAYLRVGERYNFTAATYTDVDVKDAGGNTITAGTTIPAGTEVVAQADTKVYLKENLTTDGSWIRRGGAGGPMQIGVIVPTTWTDNIVKKNGETWLKLNGQAVNIADYPALASDFATGTTLITPPMLNDAYPSPFQTSASSIYSSPNNAYPAYCAFNQANIFATPCDCWATANGTTTGWLQVKLDTPRVVTRYIIKTRGVTNASDTDSLPKDWIFEGSNTGSAGDWHQIDSQTNQLASGWPSGSYAPRQYTTTNTTPYLYYRLTITANNGLAVYTTIGELELYDDLTMVLPNYATNAAGQYSYIKAADVNMGVGGVATSSATLSGASTFSSSIADLSAFTFGVNTANLPIFNIDESTGIVRIGAGDVADDTAIALLLDSSTQAPANPQNGMMYYDTYYAKFRCYEDGEWLDCIQYLVGRPDQWEIGEEYSFGKGLYGQRFEGQITAEASAAADVELFTEDEVAGIKATGGEMGTGTGGAARRVSIPSDANWIYLDTLGYLHFTSTTDAVRDGEHNSDYDVWVKYTKGE